MNPLKLSVVIPTFNRRQVLERTLPSLLAQDFPPENYEVIVVVDGSTDGTARMLHKLEPGCGFRVLESGNRGPGAARNAGVQAARGELVLFLDDDLICAPDLLRQHCASHRDSEPLLIHGPIYIAPESSRTIVRYMTECFYDRYYPLLDPAMELRYPADIRSSISLLSSIINSSMPREILLASGGFDERLLAAEDLELGLRLWKMGVRFRSRPAAVVHELFVKSSREYLQGSVQALATGDLWAARKHPEYRPYAALSGIAETRWWKRWLLNAIVRAPVSPVGLMTVPFRLEKQLYRFAPIREAGVRLLEYASVIARLRGALTAAGSWEALQNEFGKKLPVLLYHHIGPARSGTFAELTVSPERFERQVRWLARHGYVGVRSSDWLRWLREGTGLPDKPLLITFDDGYADLAEHALPVLRRYGFGAVVFIVTGQVGGTNRWDEVQGSGTHRLMTAEQIRYWATQGIEFGAHSRTHADLTTLSVGELRKEVVGSGEELATLVGAPVVSFAYPYGSYNKDVYECVRGAFDLAFCADHSMEGFNYLSTDPHLQRRNGVPSGASLTDIRLRVRWGYNPIDKVRARLRLRSRFKRIVRFILGRGNA